MQMFYFTKKKILQNKFIRYWFRCIKFRKTKLSRNMIPEADNLSHFFYFQSLGGRNIDKVIYNIDLSDGIAGFFAIYRHIISCLYVCERFHFTPYVRVHDSRYSCNKEDNVFEYFFQQPAGLSMDDVLNSYTVVDSFSEHYGWLDDAAGSQGVLVAGYTVNDKYIKLAASVSRKYVHLLPDIKERMDKELTELLGSKRTVAIHYRGTDFRIGTYGHPVPLELEDYYPYIDECLQNGFEQIFLATDESKILEELRIKYPGIVMFYKDVARSDNEMGIHTQTSSRPKNRYLLAYEVLRDMMTMAFCDGLICGNSQVTIAARIQKESSLQKYGYIKILDKGLYQKNNKKALRRYMDKIKDEV